ncbi:MAG: aldehyde dehydrogenase family protein, partial [Bacteroidota bacterium]
GAIAAGNTVILKPSEQVPHTSALLEQMIKEYFDPQWVALVQGAVEETQTLLDQPLDYIFFTGGTAVGKIVMKAAANHLTPVTLELGGKSPVILDRQTSLSTSVKRIIWGKFLNSGQACIAPDYVLVPSDKMEEVISLMRNYLLDFYGVDPQQSPDYSRIINERHFDRVAKLIEGEVRIGGHTDREDLFIAPTIIKVDNPAEHPAMQEEIFGPILPLIPYDYLPQAIDFVNERPKPLVCYIFSTSTRNQNRIIAETSSGGVCVNDTILHWSLSDLPIGGVGDSGMGKTHGKAAFDTFSHQKSIMKRSFLIDPTSLIRFPPYKTPLGMLKDLVKWFG